jgi:hypothetical protein
VAGAGECWPSEWHHLEAEVKVVQARWQKAPDAGAAGLVEAPSAAISSPVRPQQRQRPDALSIWQMPTQVKEAWSGASLLRRPAVGTRAQACKTMLRPTCRVVQELAEAPGTRACIRLVSGASGKECPGGGHIGPGERASLAAPSARAQPTPAPGVASGARDLSGRNRWRT